MQGEDQSNSGSRYKFKSGESFIEAKANISIASSLNSLGGAVSGYKVDADTQRAPDESHQKALGSFRSVGMDDCNNPFIQAMQPQTFITWSSAITLQKDGVTLSNNKNGGFYDFSYALQQDADGNYKLKIKALVVTRYLAKDDGSGRVFLDSNDKPKQKEEKTRDFAAAASSYSEVDIVFRRCTEEAFRASANSRNYNSELQQYAPKDREYYIPEIINVKSKLYVSPGFKGYQYSCVGDDSFDIGRSGIELVEEPLDNRLAFTASALADALSVKSLKKTDRDKQIKYALIDLKELFTSPNFDNRAILAHADFGRIMESICKHNLNDDNQDVLAGFPNNCGFKEAVMNGKLALTARSLSDALSENDLEDVDRGEQIKYALIDLKELFMSPNFDNKAILSHPAFVKIMKSMGNDLSLSNQKLLASFFYDADFRDAVKNNKVAQSLFMDLIHDSKSHIIAYMVAGLSINLRAQLEHTLDEFDFWHDNALFKGQFHNASKQSEAFEKGEHTLMTIGVVAAGCAIGVVLAVGLSTLSIAIFACALVLVGVAAYKCNSMKTMKKNEMIRVHNDVAVMRADALRSSVDYRNDNQKSSSLTSGLESQRPAAKNDGVEHESSQPTIHAGRSAR